MPFKDPERRRAYHRDLMRRKRGTVVLTDSMRSDAVAPSFAPLSNKNGRAVTSEKPISVTPAVTPWQPPAERVMVVGKVVRGKLRKAYSTLRSLGYTDVAAHQLLMRQRQEAVERSQAQKEASEYTRAIERRVDAYMGPARRWLQQNSGCFTPADVERKAREMAAHTVLMSQSPRLPDEWTRLQIPAPAPGYPLIAAPPPSWPK